MQKGEEERWESLIEGVMRERKGIIYGFVSVCGVMVIKNAGSQIYM